MALKPLFESKCSRLVISAVSAGLLISSALVSPVIAQTAASLQPQKGWSVQKLKDAKGASYCALSRSYSDNSVLTLAQNGTKEYSLAVDLQKPTLDSETPYSVSLQPGPGQLRAYEVMPTSQSAFVVRLGFDENFLDALTESQTLKVQIGEDRYQYEVSDFPGGLNDLEACMGGVQPQKLSAPDMKEAAKDSSKALLDAPQKIASKADSLLSAAPKQAAQGFGAKKMTAAPAMPAPDVPVIAEPKVEITKPAIKVAEAPKATPQIETPSSKSEPIQAERLLQAEAKTTEKVAEIKISKPVVQTPELKVEPKIEIAKAPVVAAETTSKAANTVRASTMNTRAIMEMKELERKVEELRKRNNQLSGDLARSLNEKDTRSAQSLSQSQARIIDLEAKLAAAQTDNKNLLQESQRYQRLSEDSILGEAKGDWNLEQATKRFNESEREIQRLALELDREKSSCQRRTAEIESMLFDPAVADQEQRNRLVNLEKELEAVRASQGVQKEEVDRRIAEALKAQSEKAKLEKAELQQKLTTVQASLAKAQAEPKQDPKMLAEKAELSAKVASLSQEISTLKAQPKEDPVVLAENKTLKDQLSKLTHELAQSKAALMSAEAKPEVDPALTQEVQTLRAALAEAKAAPKTDPLLVAEKQALEQRVATLNEQMKAMQFDAQQNQVQGADIEKLQQKIVELTNQRDQVNDKAVIMNTELEKMRLDIAQKQGMEASRVDQSATLKLENERLRTQLSLKDKEATTYRNQTAGLQQDLAQAKSKLSLVEGQPSQQDNEVRALRQEISNLRTQMARMEANNKRTIASLQTDRKRMEASMARNAGQTPRGLKREVATSQQEPQMAANIEPAAAPAPAVSRAQPQGQVKAQPTGFSQQNLQAILSGAGISASSVRAQGAGNYGWNAGQLAGKALIKPASGRLENSIENYISNARSKCDGDFASMPSSESRGRSSYEIACVSPASSMSSSIVFFEREGSFVAIAHDVNAADMDVAMDARDRLVGQISRLQTASF